MIGLAIFAATLAGLLAWSKSRQALPEVSDPLAGFDLVRSINNASEEIAAPFTDTKPAGWQANEAAFLWAIRQAEGTADPLGYSALFGHTAARPRTFAGFADHPRTPAQFTDSEGRRLWTSAAGAYQFLAVSPVPTGGATRVDTWDRLKRRLNLPDFSPASQDRAALELIDEAGALIDVRAGRFAEAVSKVRRVWASLPGAGYSQPERSLAWLQSQYTQAGGTLG